MTHHTTETRAFPATVACFRDYNGNAPRIRPIPEVRMDPKPHSQSQPGPNRQSSDEALVDVFGTKEDSEALVVKGLLDSAGIDSVIVSLDAPQEVLPGVGGVVIRVAAGDAEEARRAIEEYRAAAEQAPDEDEAEDVSGPAA
jgi:hypothetical protein